jgi:hypothetical protein
VAISEKLVKRIEASNKAPKGEIVRTTDGRLLYLTNAELKRAAVPRRYHARIAKLLAHGGRPTAMRRARGCRGMLKWLLSNDPHSPFWRQISVDWMNNC